MLSSAGAGQARVTGDTSEHLPCAWHHSRCWRSAGGWAPFSSQASAERTGWRRCRVFLAWPYVANWWAGRGGHRASQQICKWTHLFMPIPRYQRRGGIFWAPFSVCSFTQAVGTLCTKAGRTPRTHGPERTEKAGAAHVIFQEPHW